MPPWLPRRDGTGSAMPRLFRPKPPPANIALRRAIAANLRKSAEKFGDYALIADSGSPTGSKVVHFPGSSPEWKTADKIERGERAQIKLWNIPREAWPSRRASLYWFEPDGRLTPAQPERERD